MKNRLIKITISRGDFQSMKIKGRGRRGGKGSPFPLFFYNCFDRTDLSTTSTFRAFLLINGIGLTLFDCLGRTFLCTGATGHTFVSDHISHSLHPLFYLF
jgi:hypothetical protein